MSLRFSRRKSILGGLALINFSKSGVSVSIGRPGARVTLPLFGNRSPRVTVGAPGTGISFTETLK